jgi:hypothetical protein
MITVTRTSATDFRVRLPIASAPITTTVVEWRLKQNASNTWSIQGCYGLDTLIPAGAVQLSDSGDNSVYEYAWIYLIDGAPQASADFFGNGHGNELLTSLTMLLDGADVFSLAVSGVVTGTTLVINQAATAFLPRNADSSPNGVTPIGASTLRHTFTAATLLVEHTHAMLPGFVGLTDYAAMLPNSVANFNRCRVGAGAVLTPTGSETTMAFGSQASTFAIWHATAQRYRVTLTLPSGGPDLAGDWTYAGPDKLWFFDRAAYGKCYVMYQGSTFANRRNTGSTAHKQQYMVDWFVAPSETGPQTAIAGGGSSAIGGTGATVVA